MNTLSSTETPVIQLEMLGFTSLPLTLPLRSEEAGEAYVNNPLGGSLTIEVGPLVPIQFPGTGSGSEGTRGPTGQTGPRGPRGITGFGKSAYEIWLEAGNVGTIFDFLKSLGWGVDLGGLLELIRGPVEETLNRKLSDSDAKLLAMQMLLDARLHATEVMVHEANIANAQAIANEALARADAFIVANNITESAILAESETRQTQDESYARATNILLAQLDEALRGLVLSESTALAEANQVTAGKIDLVNVRLSAEGDIGTAMNTLRSQISIANGQIDIISESITSVQANLASAVSSMTAEYNSLTGKYNAAHTVTLSVDGHVSGTRSENNGVTSRFSILATVFQVISSATSGLEWKDGRIRAYSSGIQLVFGVNFGQEGNLCFWYGPNYGAENCTKANGTIWFDNVGNAYFGGSLAAGILKNAAQTTVLTANPTISVGPFTTNGKTKVVTVGYSAASGEYVEYFPGRPQSADPPPPPTNSSPATSMSLSRQYSGGGLVTVSSTPVSHSSDVSASMYVPVDAFDPNLPAGGWMQRYRFVSSASVTYSDTLVGTGNFTYIASVGSGIFPRETQTLSVTSVEQ